MAISDPLFDLTDRVAVVTGGSRGLGREMALEFARRGADVVVASRKLDACQQVADEVERLGRRSLAVAYHAGNWGDSDRLYETVYRGFGRCDVLVNNAGMSPLYPSVDAISERLYDKVMDVNLKGPFRLSALIGTRMAGEDHGGTHGGSIIFVSSIAARQPSPTELVYGAAKAGVENLATGLARTLGPSVRVNCIAPGPFLTDISKAWDLDAFERSAKVSFALGRGGEPHEVVGAALYLASDASSYTTGAVIDVDGGPR